MTRLAALLLCVALTGLGACKTSEETPDSPASAETDEETMSKGEMAQGIIDATGTIRYVDLEGGFYGIEAEDGTKYNPLNLPETFQEDGLRVQFRAKVRTDIMSTRMWGTNVEVLVMSKLP